jgi:hypothetical protein
MTNPIVNIEHFVGINNIDDPVRLEPDVIYTSRNAYKTNHYLAEAVNVDIDDSLAVVSRVGCEKKISGTDVHSFWAHDDIGFYIDGDKLYSFDKNYDAVELYSSLNLGAKMAYAHVANKVYMTNSSFIGYYYNGAVTALEEPTREFKKSLPAGQIIAYSKGRLLVAKGRVLYMSDVFTDCYDTRFGFKVFDSEITMVRPISDGMYVSDDDTWFLRDAGEDTGNMMGMKKDKVLSEQAVPFTDILVDGQDIGEDGEKGMRAIWTSASGIFQGDGAGNIASISPKYMPSIHGRGAGVLREKDGITHYIVTLD